MKNITWTPPTAATVQFTTHNSWQLEDIFLFSSSHVMLIPYKSFNILSTRSSITDIGINILFYIRPKPRLEKNHVIINMPRNLQYPPLYLNVNKICWFGIKILSGIIWWSTCCKMSIVANIMWMKGSLKLIINGDKCLKTETMLSFRLWKNVEKC